LESSDGRQRADCSPLNIERGGLMGQVERTQDEGVSPKPKIGAEYSERCRYFARGGAKEPKNGPKGAGACAPGQRVLRPRGSAGRGQDAERTFIVCPGGSARATGSHLIGGTFVSETSGKGQEENRHLLRPNRGNTAFRPGPAETRFLRGERGSKTRRRAEKLKHKDPSTGRERELDRSKMHLGHRSRPDTGTASRTL